METENKTESLESLKEKLEEERKKFLPKHVLVNKDGLLMALSHEKHSAEFVSKLSAHQELTEVELTEDQVNAFIALRREGKMPVLKDGAIVERA
jgi:hypothetical protein